MGCGASTEAASPPPRPSYNNNNTSNGGGGGSTSSPPSQQQHLPIPKNPYVTSAPGSKSKSDDPQEAYKNAGIDRDLDRAKQQEESKIKLLLLGAGESGKSTVFKQMRILYGSVRNDDEKRMYGVVVRSNIITAMRKLCTLLKMLELEGQLAMEPMAENHNGTNMTPKQAYDLIVAHLIDGTGTPEELKQWESAPEVKDWVGTSARAGLAANTDAQQFLQLWRPIKTLWEVRPSIFLFSLLVWLLLWWTQKLC
jgi:G-protein alpha subunit